MNIHDDDVKKAQAGDNHALAEVLDAHLAHLHALADLVTVASETPDALVDGTLRNAAWLMETKAAAARDLLGQWWESNREKGKAA